MLIDFARKLRAVREKGNLLSSNHKQTTSKPQADHTMCSWLTIVDVAPRRSELQL